ncbi:Histidine kinase [Sulfidibacter corallicola]|uniref:histidine kinase n=1 Tax=Sulfidibacter corallicola TaxID=2818388 RepID=A0A8A4TWV0_SULCO|nr:HAMP domain-containing sensor histidine kinase [Sulfidibacter corallicola]QTD50995.1 HAMP domain-containing histidine kinase [Sulfidibacter corallicola]
MSFPPATLPDPATKRSPSLLSHLVLVNLAVLGIAFLITFGLLDGYLRGKLWEDLDSELQTHVMVLTTEIDRISPTPTRRDWARLLEQFGLAHGIAHSIFQLLDGEGHLLAGSEPLHWQDLTSSVTGLAGLELYAFRWETQDLEGRIVRLLYYRLSEDHILRVGLDTVELRRQIHQSRLIFVVGALTTMILTVGFSFLNTRKAIQGVRAVTRKAQSIRGRNQLGEQVELPTGFRETDELAGTFNEMQGRIRRLVQNLKMVMDHFAHDLKTPITRLRGLGEERVRRGSGDLEFGAAVVGECDRIMVLLESLLEITSADSGLHPWRHERFDWAAEVAEGCELFRPAIEGKGLDLRLNLPETQHIQGDARALQRIVANLIENAIKYTERGWIEVTLTATAEGARLQVTDSGIGIAETDVDRVFEPFFRVDQSRSGGGHGLGLSYCKAVLQAMGGQIRCEPQPEGGTRFTVEVPSHTAPKSP